MHGHPTHTKIHQHQFPFIDGIVIFHIVQHSRVMTCRDNARKTESIRRVHQHLPLKKPLHPAFIVELLKFPQGLLERLACNRLRLESVGNIVIIQRQS